MSSECLRERQPPSASASGTYKFKLTGDKVKFTKVSDSNPACVGRHMVVSGTFTKVS